MEFHSCPTSFPVYCRIPVRIFVPRRHSVLPRMVCLPACPLQHRNRLAQSIRTPPCLLHVDSSCPCGCTAASIIASVSDEESIASGGSAGEDCKGLHPCPHHPTCLETCSKHRNPVKLFSACISSGACSCVHRSP